MTTRLFGKTVIIIGAMLVLACGGDTGPDSSNAAGGAAGSGGGGGAAAICDPLAAQPSPTSLGEVLAAGRHSDGTLYVVDSDDDAMHRVFVSDGETLYRQRIAGEAGGIDGGTEYYVFSVTEGEPFTLKIETNPLRMGVVRGETVDLRDFEIGQVGDVLQVVDEGVLSELQVQNLSGEVVVEYVAQVEDGRRLVVTRPRDDWGYEDFRLFLGDADQLLERRVLNAIRALDGGSTEISFETASGTATADFPISGQWALVTGDENLSLTRLEADAGALQGLSFYCGGF